MVYRTVELVRIGLGFWRGALDIGRLWVLSYRVYFLFLILYISCLMVLFYFILFGWVGLMVLIMHMHRAALGYICLYIRSISLKPIFRII